jgi:ABC-type transport system involved in multi-copper enzyme maturation permease subunit
MKTLLKIEFERAFRSRELLISLIIGLIITIVQFVVVVLPVSNHILTFFEGSAISYPRSVFNWWVAVDGLHPYLRIYLTIFPLLAAIPYASTYFSDRKQGYMKYICSRTNRKSYLFAKYVSIFVSGGIAVTLPMLINLLLTASVLPSLIPVGTGNFLSSSCIFSDVFYVHPYLYITIYMLMYFIYGGVFASLSLLCSKIFDYKFFVLIFPFAIYYGLGIIAPYIKIGNLKSFNPRQILSMNAGACISIGTFFGEALLIGFISYVLYMWKGVKSDIF